MRAFIVLLASALSCLASTVEINLRDYASTSLNTQVIITNLSNPTFGGTNVYALPSQKFQPRNGQVSAVLHAGAYRALIGPYTIGFNVPDDNATYQLADLATNGVAVTAISTFYYPRSNPSNYVTSATVDAKLDATNGNAYFTGIGYSLQKPGGGLANTFTLQTNGSSWLGTNFTSVADGDGPWTHTTALGYSTFKRGTWTNVAGIVSNLISGAWQAADTTTSNNIISTIQAGDAASTNRTTAITRTLSVLDYGATPGAVAQISDSYNPASLTPQDTAIQAALNAAASGGTNTIVYFPPGIYKITNSALYVSNNVHLVGAGRPYSHGYSNPESQNKYSLIWFANTNATGVWFPLMANGQASMQEMGFCGFVSNPIPGWVKMSTNSLSQFAHSGLQVGDTNTSWCGGFYAKNVSWTGFKQGVRCDAGQSEFVDCSWGGNGIGFASLGSSVNSVTNALANAGRYSIWTNVLQFANPPMGGWNYVYPDHLVLRRCAGGRREGGLVYFFGAGRSIHIDHDTSYHFDTFLTAYGVEGRISDTFQEISTTEGLVGGTNYAVSLGANFLALENCNLVYVGQGSYPTNKYGVYMTNFACVNEYGYGNPSSLKFSRVKIDLGNTTWNNQLNLLVDTVEGTGLRVETDGTRGFLRMRSSSPVWFCRLPDKGVFSGYAQFINPWSVATTTNQASYDWRSFGAVELTYGQPDYLTFWGRTNSTYTGTFPQPQENAARFRLLASDPYIPGGTLKSTGAYNIEIPPNYTVDTLRAWTNLYVGTNPVVHYGNSDRVRYLHRYDWRIYSSPAPALTEGPNWHFFPDMHYAAPGTNLDFYLSCPSWATQVTVSAGFCLESGSPVSVTNTLQEVYHEPGNRFFGSIITNVFNADSNLLTVSITSSLHTNEWKGVRWKILHYPNYKYVASPMKLTFQ